MAYTEEQLKEAARKALAAGDTAAAKRLIDAARKAGTSAPSQPAAPSPEVFAVTDKLQTLAPVQTGMFAGKAAAMSQSPGPFLDQGKLPNSGPPATVKAGDGSEMVYNPETNQYTNKGMMAQNMRPDAIDAFMSGSAQGVTFGAFDELAGLQSPFMREKARAFAEAAQRDHPIASGIGELAGAVSVPIPAPKGKALWDVVKSSASLAALYSGIYAFNSAEGGVANRATDAVKGAAGGALIGAAAPVVIRGISKGLQAVLGQSYKLPTVDNLRTAKTAAYRAVENAGETFTPVEVDGLVRNVETALDAANYVGGFGQQTDIQLARLKRLAEKGGGVTLSALDDIRGRLWSAYSKASDETELLDIIGEIDGMIDGRTATSPLLDAARAANSRYKKAQMLTDAFQKAADQTKATGSGGNILNKYRQAVVAIIDNPKKAKWFTAAEISTMRDFLNGKVGEDVLRHIGKMAPDSNGLMMALNIGAIAANPGMAGVAALASGAKAISDTQASRGAKSLIGMVGGGAAPVDPVYRGLGAGTSAIAGNALAKRF